MSTINNGTKNNDERNKCQECMGCAALGIGLLSVLAIVAGGIYHIYLSIAGLAGVSNGDIRKLCNSSAINATSEYTYIGDDPSEIWMYVLMSLIFVSGGIGNTAKNATEVKEDGSSLTISEQMCALHCSAILFGGFCGWGWDQIWNSGTCLEHNFGNETLMTSARIHFYIQAVVCGLIALFDIILIIGFIGMTTYDKCRQKTVDSPRVTHMSDDHRLRQVITGGAENINGNGKDQRPGVYGASGTDVRDTV
tara:strand:- start:3599 stop:4351 length:753 start_codon:yes stop_codon:yes gene_type:complete